jgi:hypothetical protein
MSVYISTGLYYQIILLIDSNRSAQINGRTGEFCCASERGDGSTA